MDELLTRQMPHSPQAEQAVLGSMLIDADCIKDVMDQLQPDDFYLRQNREIFETIYSMFIYSKPIDGVTVAGEMEKNGLYNDNTRPYLLQLMEVTPTSANVMEYVRIVREKALMRSVAAAASEITAMVQEGTGAAAINQFYRSEMEVLRADCDTWFNVVSEKNYPDTRTNGFAYRLLDAPAGFLAVERVMEVDGTANHYFTELFSLVSGWQRSFSDLYNTTVKCESRIRGAVRDWCVSNQIPCDELDTLSLSQLTAAFLPDGDSLRLYIDHRTLSVQQEQAVIVEIPLRDLEDFRLN